MTTVFPLMNWFHSVQYNNVNRHTHTHMGSTHNPVLIGGGPSCLKQRREPRLSLKFTFVRLEFTIYGKERRCSSVYGILMIWGKWTKTVYNRRIIFRMMREAWFSWDELANASRARSFNFTAIRCFICILIGVEWNVLPPKRYGEAILAFYYNND